MSNVAPLEPRVGNALVRLFEQFEPAYPGCVPIRSLADHVAITAADIRDALIERLDQPTPGSKLYWDRLMRAVDGKAAAIEFRDRMRAERAKYGDNGSQITLSGLPGEGSR